MKIVRVTCLMLAWSGSSMLAQVTMDPARVSEGVMQDFLVHKVKAVVPSEPGVHVDGPVTLRAVVDTSGNVESLQLVSGHPMLVPAAMDAVKEWKYRPYLINGIPVRVETTIHVFFPPPTESAKESGPDSTTKGTVEVPFEIGQDLLIRKVAPVYPPLARAARIQGLVVLSITINKDGEVRDPKLVSGHPMLAPAAIEAVKQWRYKPYISDEQAVEVETVVRVNFKLADGPAENGREGLAAAAEHRSAAPTAGTAVLQRVRVSSGVMQGLLAAKVDPEYPADAKGKHIEGTVVLSVVIDREGSVSRVELVSGHPLLGAAATDAVLEWKYRPFTLNGEAVAVETTVSVNFTLPK